MNSSQLAEDNSFVSCGKYVFFTSFAMFPICKSGSLQAPPTPSTDRSALEKATPSELLPPGPLYYIQGMCCTTLCARQSSLPRGLPSLPCPDWDPPTHHGDPKSIMRPEPIMVTKNPSKFIMVSPNPSKPIMVTSTHHADPKSIQIHHGDPKSIEIHHGDPISCSLMAFPLVIHNIIIFVPLEDKPPDSLRLPLRWSIFGRSLRNGQSSANVRETRPLLNRE